MVQQYLILKKRCLIEAREMLTGKLPEMLEPEELEVACTLIKDAVVYHKRCFRDGDAVTGTDAAERTDIQ